MIESVAEMRQLSEDQLDEFACRAMRELAEHPTYETFTRCQRLLFSASQRLSDARVVELWDAVMSAPDDVAEANSSASRITAEDIAWTKSQPVVGDPSLTRLRMVLRRAGLNPVEMALADGGDTLKFRLVRSSGLQELDRKQMLRLLISVLRRGGLDVGYSEVEVADMDDLVVTGETFTAPFTLAIAGAMLWAILFISAFIAWGCLFHARAKSIVQKWAAEHGHVVLQFESPFHTGPFRWWTTSRGQIVYCVAIRDGAGRERKAWVRCGSYTGSVLFSDQIEVRWQDEPKAA